MQSDRRRSKKVKDGSYKKDTIKKVLDKTGRERFFTEDEFKDIEKEKCESERSEVEYCFAEFLGRIIRGKKVKEEEYVELVDKIVEGFCRCNYTNKKIPKNLKNSVPHIVTVCSIYPNDGFVSFPILFGKDSPLYRACELHIEIKRYDDMKYEAGNCRAKFRTCERRVSDLEESIESYKKTIQEEKKEISKRKQKTKKLLEEIKDKESRKLEVQLSIKELEENIEEYRLQYESKINSLKEKISNKYRNESWFTATAEENGLLNQFQE